MPNPPLRSGKPTYVDKTFAPDDDTARRIFAIAEEHGTPCYSTSALRCAAEYQEIDPATVIAISSWGPGDLETYSIHQLEPIMMLMKAAPARVLYTESGRWYTLLIDFRMGGRPPFPPSRKVPPFAMNICRPGGNLCVEVKSDFFQEFIRRLLDFYRTGEPLVPPSGDHRHHGRACRGDPRPAHPPAYGWTCKFVW